MRRAIVAGAAPQAPTVVTVTVPAPAPPPSPPPPPLVVEAEQSWTMPDLVGVGLQDAQDRIQELTDFGIPVTTSHDATGAERMQVSDRNWKVCTQNVAPGTTITSSTRIDFGAVKLEEEC